jgi:folate-binding protein YgfZ
MAATRWTALPSMSVIAATGRDARAFLQGQLTNDLLTVDRHPGMLAAACNRQGRVLAILRLAARGEEVRMVLPRALAPLLVAHLSRFVLRAAVDFVDSRQGVLGLLDAEPALQLAAAEAGLTVLVAGPSRTLLVGDPATARSVLADLPASTAGDWERASIEDGEPMVYPETSGVWVPQMLNLDLLGAVSFSKGCYLGQEIVTRAQHLGRIKRRMLRYRAPPGAAPVPGQSLYAGTTPAAQVVRASDESGVQCLAVVELADCGELLGARPGGAEFVPSGLPYAIPAAAAEEAALPAG